MLVEHMLVSRLGWYLLPAGKPCSIKHLSVKTATALQLGAVRVERRNRTRQFVCCALNSSDPTAVRDGMGSVAVAQRKLWKLRWDNHYKEVYWRVVLNGVATAARMPGVLRHACLCGYNCPDCVHHFWSCPIAQAVVQTIVDQLSPAWCTHTPGTAPLLMQHIWLMQPPQGSRVVHTCVWRVVCLAAFNAMDVGRRAANQQHVLDRQQTDAANAAGRPRAPPAGQQLITQLLQPAPLTAAQVVHNQAVQQRREQQQQQRQQQRQQELDSLVQRMKREAAARFWELLADFIVMRAAPASWLELVPADHPFIRVVDRQLQLAPRRG
jgi:hypothetical protein